MGGLHGQRHANAKRRQRDHRRSAHSNEDHLSEDRRDLEKLSGERRDQNPVEQAEIKLDVIFQIMAVSDAQDDKTGASTKAENLSALLHRLDPIRRAAYGCLSGSGRQWLKAKSRPSARC